MKFLKYVTKNDMSILDFFFIFNAIQIGELVSSNLLLQCIVSFVVSLPLIAISQYLKGIAKNEC